MTDLATLFGIEGEEKKAIAIAKKLLARGFSADAVVEDTGLDDTVVRELQAELNLNRR